jgi:adenylate cyclase
MRVARQQALQHPDVAPRTAAAPDAREPGAKLVDRLWRRGMVALGLANGAGALLTFALGAWVIPTTEGALHGDHLKVNAIGFVAVILFSLPVGTYLSRRLSREASDWLREDRMPTPRERRATLSFPLRQTALEAMLWGLAAVVFITINIPAHGTLALEAGLEVVLGGLVTCTLTYLLAERINQPATARALETAVPERPTGPAIGCRLLLTWGASSMVPLVAIGLIGYATLRHDDLPRDQIGLAVVVIAVLGALVGLATLTMSARSLAEPLRDLRTALGRVEAGDLDVSVPVNDAGEVGVLQAGFNRMAHGVRERERLRDLFGRHVGEDVARYALEREDVELGGEAREAAVLFVDVIGSTRLAATHDPTEVVARLNAFFAIVVDCVSLHGGWVNKFEGDAALCVFGAPTPLPDAAGSALATARAVRFRLESELDGVQAAIGVSAGEVVAGNVGAAERFEYTVIGDPVNEAARLTELAKTMPGRLLASAAALERAGDRERARWQVDGAESLRGRTTPTRLAVPR